MRRIPFAARGLMILLACCLLAGAAGAESPGESSSGIPERLDRLMRAYGAVGASVIVAREEEILLR